MDVFGLDDAPTASAEPETPRLPAATRGKRRSRSDRGSVAPPSAGELGSNPYMNGIGATICGLIVMIAPELFGRRFDVLNRFPPSTKRTLGILMVLAGVVSLALEFAKVPRTVRVGVEYALGGLIVVAVLLGFTLAGTTGSDRPAAAAKAAGADAAHPDLASLERPPSRPSVTVKPAPEGESIKFTMFEGKARVLSANGPFVTDEFEAKHRLERGSLDPSQPLRLLVYSPKVRRAYAFIDLKPEGGTLKKTESILDAGYGPFEAVLGIDGQSEELIVGKHFQRLPNTISLEQRGDPKP